MKLRCICKKFARAAGSSLAALRLPVSFEGRETDRIRCVRMPTALLLVSMQFQPSRNGASVQYK